MVRRTGARREDANGRGNGSALGPLGRGLLGRVFGARADDRPKAHDEAMVVAIASGKGGTGKSFVATSLAVVLHRRQRRVTLTDCDFGLACDHLLLGVRPKHTLQHVLSGEAKLADVRIATPAGPFLVPGASGIVQMADLNDRQLLVLGSVLAEIAAGDDVLLLDVGAGIAPQCVLTLLSADHVVIVTQPEIAALTDAYAVVKCCAQLRPTSRFAVVVNRVMAKGQGDATFAKLAEVARRHTGVELAYLGEIAEDPTVTQRRLGQQPLVVTDPDGATAQALHAIAERLEEVAGPLRRRRVAAESCLEARFREHRLFLT